MKKSIKNSTPEEFEDYVKICLSYEGYTEKNEMLVRAVEIIKKQEEQILSFKIALGMITPHRNSLHE